MCCFFGCNLLKCFCVDCFVDVIDTSGPPYEIDFKFAPTETDLWAIPHKLLHEKSSWALIRSLMKVLRKKADFWDKLETKWAHWTYYTYTYTYLLRVGPCWNECGWVTRLCSGPAGIGHLSLKRKGALSVAENGGSLRRSCEFGSDMLWPPPLESEGECSEKSEPAQPLFV